jgi:2-C-methyl-D-erythritol 4-phosphate cytidylyltransferase
VQTPQVFHLEIIRKAHQLALARGIDQATDDCSLVNTFRLTPVYMATGQVDNIKITYSHDLQLAEKILQRRKQI